MKKLFVLVLLLLILGTSYWYAVKKNQPVAPLETEKPLADSQPTNPAFKITMFGGIGVAQSQGQSYLVDQKGLTLYLNTKDEGRANNTKPACNTSCEKTWLPYLYDGVSGGIASGSKDPLLSRLNIYTRTDGQMQYALGTKPLYRYVYDQTQGELKGAGSTGWEIARP